MFIRINERASAKKVLFTIYELRKVKVKFLLSSSVPSCAIPLKKVLNQ